jgi:hypothetical protein
MLVAVAQVVAFGVATMLLMALQHLAVVMVAKLLLAMLAL